MLGWWWLFEAVAALSYIWLPFVWIYALVNVIVFLPSFVAFVRMMNSNDRSDKREQLYTVWKWCGCVFGLLAIFSFYLTWYLIFNNWIVTLCETLDPVGYTGDCV